MSEWTIWKDNKTCGSYRANTASEALAAHAEAIGYGVSRTIKSITVELDDVRDILDYLDGNVDSLSSGAIDRLQRAVGDAS